MTTLNHSINLDHHMNPEERKYYSFIYKNRPELKSNYLSYLKPARKGILQRLLQAIVRENLVETKNFVTCKSGNIYAYFSKDTILRLPIQMYSMNRFDIVGSVTLEKNKQTRILEHPTQLLDLLFHNLPKDKESKDRFHRFYKEIENSVANYALALAGSTWRQQNLKNEAGTQIQSCLEWVQKRKEIDPYFSILVFFEQWVVDGHPLHPGSKIKMGLDVGDVITYSPEWGAMPRLIPVAIHKESCKMNTYGKWTCSEILFKEYPGLEKQMENELVKHNLKKEDYEIIPVHPWQYKNTILAMFSNEIEKKHIIPILNYRISTATLMSLRTVAPIQLQGEFKHHIKTAMAVQTTGTVRTISPQSASNGPIVSKIMRKIQDKENNFNNTFVITEERVGIFFDPKNACENEERIQKNKNLVAIFRENVESYVMEDEIAMPGSSLLAKCPFSKEPIVGEVIKEFLSHYQLESIEEATVHFMYHYAKAALPGFITLLSRYGISLEGHLQNSVPVFLNGKPVRMILRDFGGIRMLRSRMEKQGLLVKCYPGSVTITDDEQDVRNKVFYPVFQNHFGELILCISRWCGVKEERLWEPIIRVINAVFNELKKDKEIFSQVVEDRKSLFSKEIDLKAMTTMRLLGEITNYTFSRVPNPLYETQKDMNVI